MKFTIKSLLGVLLIIAALFILAAPPAAQAQYFNPRYGTVYGATNIAAATTTNFSGTAIPVWAGRGLSVFVNAVNTNGAVTTHYMTNWFDVTYDGTNWSNSKPLSWAVTFSAATVVRDWKYFPPSTLDNVKAIRLACIQNTGTNLLFVTNLTWCLYP